MRYSLKFVTFNVFFYPDDKIYIEDFMQKIIIASDHAGFELKNKIIKHLNTKEYIIKDNGCYSQEAADYPVIAKETAKLVSDGTFDKGILICGTGIGMSIAANKINGIRAAVCTDTTCARFSRLHNNSNILCLGQRIIGEYLAYDICDIWLNTDFEAERHLKRVNLIENFYS